MKNRKISKSWMRFFVILMGVLAFTFLQLHAQANAAVNCSSATDIYADTDSDGFGDYDECYGITYAGRGSISGRVGCRDRASCLDPDSPDLFVILVKPSKGSLIPTNPFEYIINNLGIYTHQITSTNAAADRTVCTTCTQPADSTTRQKAVMITESLDTSTLDVLGQANCGTPNDLDYATVFTKRIQQHVNNVYSPASPPTGLIDKYIKHTIAHEIGHMIRLRSEYDDRYGGYHYNPGDQNIVVMDQSVSYSGSGANASYNIGTAFDLADKSGTTKFKLK